jgi:hypothetical protein
MCLMLGNICYIRVTYTCYPDYSTEMECKEITYEQFFLSI